MSYVLVLASDVKMPDVYNDDGLFVEKNDYDLNSCQEIEGLIKKEYLYTIHITANYLALSKLKEYLLKNMKSDSEIELWSFWLGGDRTKHLHTMPKISNVPNSNIKDVEDMIDYYSENYFNVEKRKTNIFKLSIVELSFINDKSGRCLIVSNNDLT